MGYYKIKNDHTIMWNVLLFKYIYISKEVSSRGLQPISLCFRIMVLKPFLPHPPSVILRGGLGWGDLGERWHKDMVQRKKWNYVKPAWAVWGRGASRLCKRAWTASQATPGFSPCSTMCLVWGTSTHSGPSPPLVRWWWWPWHRS